MILPELFISVDIEANGPIPGEYSMVSLGACLVAHPEESFYVELKPLHERFDRKALSVSGFTMDHLRDKGEDPAAAMARFARWIEERAAKTHRPVFVAFNATFDWMFVHWYLIRFAGTNPFGVSGLDIKAYFMGMDACAWGDTRKSDVRRRFPPRQAHTHHALDDAREQAEIFAQMLAARGRIP